MVLTWAASGKGECPISLEDAQHLALDAGFEFQGATEAMPLARRADLQAMFEHFGVNSLSAFRRKFWAYELRPHTSLRGGGSGSAGSAGTAPLGLPGAPATPSRGGGGRSRWGVQQAGDETYVGELLDGRRHGSGVLLTKAPRSWVLHVGRFSEGKRNGPGVVATSRGERFEGFFLDDVMWGPGEYRFAPPAEAPGGKSSGDHGAAAGCGGSSSGAAGGAAAAPAGAAEQAPAAAAGPHRICFRGMMNGQPSGKGCLEWSDGSVQAGQFDGCNCYLAMREEEVAGVLLVAADNAEEARAAAAEAQAAAARQRPDIAQRAVQLFASLEAPA
ncbi:hypothetical protein ABPG75_005299 [Micractinium tetrahymenae]